MITTNDLLESFQKIFPSIPFQADGDFIGAFVQGPHYSFECVTALHQPAEEGALQYIEYWLWFGDQNQSRFCLSGMDEIPLALALYELHRMFEFGTLRTRQCEDGAVNIALFRTIEVSSQDLLTESFVPESSRVARYQSQLIMEAKSVTDVIAGLASNQITSHLAIRQFLQMSDTTGLVAS